jgi:CRISPR-associated protein Cmr3
MSESKCKTPFKYLITIEPLGFLYGSAGAFLSPENLVGRSGAKFPPSPVALAGIFAASYPETTEAEREQKQEQLQSLRLAGPFWSFTENIQNFCVPTPFNLKVNLLPNPEPLEIQTGQIIQTLTWKEKSNSNPYDCWEPDKTAPSKTKFDSETWLPIKDWRNPTTVYANPWQFVPHLHPKLQQDQRRVVDPETNQGSLFLENAVQMHPKTCLTYLSNEKMDGWYRFGGEGHLASVQSHDLDQQTETLLNMSLGNAFALITPALWGSNRLSLRYPKAWEGSISTMLTERPNPFRYRLGGKGKTKRLSRGRYAVPAGTVYITKQTQPPWCKWQEGKEGIFPQDGDFLNLKNWGFGLALPLKIGTPNANEET